MAQKDARDLIFLPKFVLLGLCATFFATEACAATRVYTDFGRGNSYGTGCWCSMGVAGSCNTPPETLYNAGRFTPSASGVLDHLDLAIFYFSGFRGISVSLVPDNGSDAPAIQTPLEEWIVTAGLPNNAYPNHTNPVHLTSKLYPPLSVGSLYWIVVMPLSYDAAACWSLNVTGVGSTEQGESTNGGVTWGHYGDAPAFDVWIK